MTEPLKQPTAGEQEWPKEWIRAIQSAPMQVGMDEPGYPAYHITLPEHAIAALNALSKAGALRPPAGVDTDAGYARGVEDAAKIADEEYNPWLSGIDNKGREIEKDRGRNPSWRDGRNLTAIGIADKIRLLRSHHTAVTAAGVDTVGHTDVMVTVPELAAFLVPRLRRWDTDEYYSSIDVSEEIIDQFNVTRKA